MHNLLFLYFDGTFFICLTSVRIVVLLLRNSSLLIRLFVRTDSVIRAAVENLLRTRKSHHENQTGPFSSEFLPLEILYSDQNSMKISFFF